MGGGFSVLDLAKCPMSLSTQVSVLLLFLCSLKLPVCLSLLNWLYHSAGSLIKDFNST